MAQTVASPAALTPRERLDALRPVPAKVLTNREDLTDRREKVGAALGRAIAVVGLSIKEAAVLMNRDAAQVSRWISGAERVQVDAVYGTKLHGPFAVEQARDDHSCVVETTVTYRRSA